MFWFYRYSTQKLFNFLQREGNIEHLAPPLSDEDFNKPVGKYSQSIFQSNTTRALTATSLGNLVVWDSTKTGGRGKWIGDASDGL